MDRKDKPWIKDPDGELGTYWYDIDPSQIGAVYTEFDDFCPSYENHEGLEGFLIPLYESEEIRNLKDMNAYFRNLHYWESLIDRNQITPSVLRMIWMAESRYAEVKEMHDISDTFSMLGSMPVEQIEPERIQQLRNFFHTDSDDVSDFIERLRLSFTKLVKGDELSELNKGDRMRRKDSYSSRLLKQLVDLDNEIRETKDSARMENERKQVKLNEIQQMMEQTRAESDMKVEALRLKIDELNTKKQSILDELKNHDIQ